MFWIASMKEDLFIKILVSEGMKRIAACVLTILLGICLWGNVETFGQEATVMEAPKAVDDEKPAATDGAGPGEPSEKVESPTSAAPEKSAETAQPAESAEPAKSPEAAKEAAAERAASAEGGWRTDEKVARNSAVQTAEVLLAESGYTSFETVATRVVEKQYSNGAWWYRYEAVVRGTKKTATRDDQIVRFSGGKWRDFNKARDSAIGEGKLKLAMCRYTEFNVLATRLVSMEWSDGAWLYEYEAVVQGEKPLREGRDVVRAHGSQWGSEKQAYGDAVNAAKVELAKKGFTKFGVLVGDLTSIRWDGSKWVYQYNVVIEGRSSQDEDFPQKPVAVPEQKAAAALPGMRVMTIKGGRWADEEMAREAAIKMAEVALAEAGYTRFETVETHPVSEAAKDARWPYEYEAVVKGFFPVRGEQSTKKVIGERKDNKDAAYASAIKKAEAELAAQGYMDCDIQASRLYFYEVATPNTTMYQYEVVARGGRRVVGEGAIRRVSGVEEPDKEDAEKSAVRLAKVELAAQGYSKFDVQATRLISERWNGASTSYRYEAVVRGKGREAEKNAIQRMSGDENPDKDVAYQSAIDKAKIELAAQGHTKFEVVTSRLVSKRWNGASTSYRYEVVVHAVEPAGLLGRMIRRITGARAAADHDANVASANPAEEQPKTVEEAETFAALSKLANDALSAKDFSTAKAALKKAFERALSPDELFEVAQLANKGKQKSSELAALEKSALMDAVIYAFDNDRDSVVKKAMSLGLSKADIAEARMKWIERASTYPQLLEIYQEASLAKDFASARVALEKAAAVAPTADDLLDLIVSAREIKAMEGITAFRQNVLDEAVLRGSTQSLFMGDLASVYRLTLRSREAILEERLLRADGAIPNYMPPAADRSGLATAFSDADRRQADEAAAKHDAARMKYAQVKVLLQGLEAEEEKLEKLERDLKTAGVQAADAKRRGIAVKLMETRNKMSRLADKIALARGQLNAISGEIYIHGAVYNGLEGKTVNSNELARNGAAAQEQAERVHALSEDAMAGAARLQLGDDPEVQRAMADIRGDEPAEAAPPKVVAEEKTGAEPQSQRERCDALMEGIPQVPRHAAALADD